MVCARGTASPLTRDTNSVIEKADPHDDLAFVMTPLPGRSDRKRCMQGECGHA
jgi:hypothetical protein